MNSSSSWKLNIGYFVTQILKDELLQSNIYLFYLNDNESFFPYGEEFEWIEMYMSFIRNAINNSKCIVVIFVPFSIAIWIIQLPLTCKWIQFDMQNNCLKIKGSWQMT